MKNKIPSENRVPENQEGESFLKDTLSALKKLKIPPTLRASNKQRINLALAEQEKGAERSRFWWWRRRISIPVPIAAGILIAFCLLGFLQIRQINQLPAASERLEQKSGETGTAGEGAATTGKARKAYYYEKALYVSRVGFINREYGYQLLKENNYENNQ